MATTLTVPELGESVDSVDVVRVLVEVGDRVAVDQPVIEVETEKASVEIPSDTAGVIKEILVAPGDSLGAGAAIATIEAEAIDQPPDDRPTESAPPVDPPLASSEPAQSPPPPEPGEPEPAERAAAVEETAPLAAGDRRLAPRWAAAEGSRPLVPAAPTVRRFAREVGVDIGQVRGSGPGGRISIDDIKAFAAQVISQAAASPLRAASPDLPDLASWGEVRRESMSKVRQATARNMARAWVTVPQVTHHDEADITELEALRAAYRGRVEAAGGKLTVTSILVKIVASALRVFPKLNAAVDVVRQEVVFRQYVHIGVAVDTDRGLLVPVIRDADRKNITAISTELDDLARRARERKLKPDEMQGAGFSISNLGGIGGTGFSPIVNWPEVAILGVSRASHQPRWGGAAFQPRLILPLSLSYDHRLVDGADAARFVRWVAEAVEEPLLLALEG
jgi:pyruvate dehydrogenase E2 component (dihydrolipoamide acetyltransferase)